MSAEDGIAVWCKDCKYYYNSIEANGCVCTNPDSNWVTDFPDEYCSFVKGDQKMNKVIMIGRLGKDPEVRYIQSAEPLAVCRFSVAVDRPYKKDRQEGEATCDFINCVSFGRRGENIGQYFRKGNRIAVTGRLQVSNYTDRKGNKRYSTDVVVEDFEFCESKSEKNNAVSDNMPEASGFGAAEDVEDEDLPF